VAIDKIRFRRKSHMVGALVNVAEKLGFTNKMEKTGILDISGDS